MQVPGAKPVLILRTSHLGLGRRHLGRLCGECEPGLLAGLLLVGRGCRFPFPHLPSPPTLIRSGQGGRGGGQGSMAHLGLYWSTNFVRFCELFLQRMKAKCREAATHPAEGARPARLLAAHAARPVFSRLAGFLPRLLGRLSGPKIHRHWEWPRLGHKLGASGTQHTAPRAKLAGWPVRAWQ